MDLIAGHGFALLLLAAYTALLLWHGQVGRRGTAGLDDYYVGGRQMGGVAIGISFYATYASTNTYIGNAGQSWAWGVPWLLFPVLMLLIVMLSWGTVAPRMRAFTAAWGALTLPEFFAARYASRPLRVLSALIVLFASTLYMTAIYKGTGLLFESFLAVPYPAAIGFVLLIVMLYTAVGGFVSVVRTDVVQGIMMLFGAVLLGGGVMLAAGGPLAFLALGDQPDTAHLLTADAAMPFPVLTGILLAGAMKLMVEPRQLSRFFALRDRHQLRVGMWVSFGGILVIVGSLLPVGLYARLLLPGPIEDTDTIVPLLVTSGQVFPPMVADFLVLAMLAAAMSSLDSVLLVAGACVVRDVVAPLRGDAHVDQLRMTRIAVVALSVLTAIIALEPPGGIVELTFFSGSLYAACFLPTLLFGLWWRGGNARAAIGSMLVGAAVLAAWLGFDLRGIAHEVYPAMAASFMAFLLLAWRAPAVADARIDAAFAAARAGRSS